MKQLKNIFSSAYLCYHLITFIIFVYTLREMHLHVLIPDSDVESLKTHEC